MNELDFSGLKTGRLKTAAPALGRRNRLAERNKTLSRWIEENGGAAGAGEAQADISEVLDACLSNLIENADEDAVKSEGFLSLITSMEMHRAKVAKLKADTESVLINVATPTALRKMFNAFGMAVLRGNETGVEECLALARSPEERDLIISVGATVYQRVMEQIQRTGQEDAALSALLSAVQ